MNRTIAVVEDDPRLRENYTQVLHRNTFEVQAFSNRPEAWKALSQQLPDMAILDISLEQEPEGGFELCRQLRAESPTLPIILLTARDSELDIVSGLRLGADDYLVKDISMEQLVARVLALFRRQDALRSNTQQGASIVQGELETTDAEDRSVERFRGYSIHRPRRPRNLNHPAFRQTSFENSVQVVEQ